MVNVASKVSGRLGWRTPLLVFGVAVVYCATARLGLSLAFQTKQVTAVWPPTGIALAALLMFGFRAWPAIAVGAFVINPDLERHRGCCR